jgi:hypothetical protein
MILRNKIELMIINTLLFHAELLTVHAGIDSSLRASPMQVSY